MNGRVAGKIAIVFGAGQTPGETIGNGRATALVLAREGAQVTVVDSDLERALETVRLIEAQGGPSASALQANATAEAQVRSVIDAVQQRWGRVDILHNNIGASIALGDASAESMSEAAFDLSFAVNLKSAWLATKHVLPLMRQQASGSIVNISSLAAAQAYPLVGYKTMKAAVLGLTENTAAANAAFGIRVNSILPGLMNTPMAIEARVQQGRERAEVIAARDSRIPLGRRMGTGWDVAHAALFLHSDEAAFITGIGLVIDGGELVCHGL